MYFQLQVKKLQIVTITNTNTFCVWNDCPRSLYSHLLETCFWICIAGMKLSGEFCLSTVLKPKPPVGDMVHSLLSHSNCFAIPDCILDTAVKSRTSFKTLAFYFEIAVILFQPLICFVYAIVMGISWSCCIALRLCSYKKFRKLRCWILPNYFKQGIYKIYLRQINIHTES